VFETCNWIASGGERRSVSHVKATYTSKIYSAGNIYRVAEVDCLDGRQIAVRWIAAAQDQVR